MILVVGGKNEQSIFSGYSYYKYWDNLLSVFSVPYITHSTVVKNPDAMLPVEAWDAAGMTLTIGLIPLIIANVLGFIFVKFRSKSVRLLWFAPGVICFA